MDISTMVIVCTMYMHLGGEQIFQEIQTHWQAALFFKMIMRMIMANNRVFPLKNEKDERIAQVKFVSIQWLLVDQFVLRFK